MLVVMWEWVWLVVGIVGLALLWLAIQSVEKLMVSLKTRDEHRRTADAALEKHIADEEADFLRVEAARDYLINAKPEQNPDPNYVPPEFREAMNVLNGDQLMDAMAERIFGAAPDATSISATQSAFDAEPVRTAVASGNNAAPIQPKASKRNALSKEEKKMLKKMKQGY